MYVSQILEVEIDPNDIKIIEQQSKICNNLYNLLVEYINDKNKEVTSDELLNFYIEKRKTSKYLYKLHFTNVRDVIKRLITSITKTKEHDTLVKYRSNNVKWFSLYYTFKEGGGARIENKSIYITIGNYFRSEEYKNYEIRINLKEKVRQGYITSCRLINEYQKYYLVFIIRVEEPIKNNGKRFLSIDLNHKNLFVGIDYNYNSIECKNLKLIKYFDGKIDNLKSKRSKCKKELITENNKSYYKTSKKYDVYDNAIKNIYNKRKSQLEQTLYSIANYLEKKYDVIVIGNYTPSTDVCENKNMRRAILNQTIIGKFREILTFVFQKNGKKVIIIDEKNTTSLCHNCRYFERKSPDVREFVCPKCKKASNRDLNSAINIAIKAGYITHYEIRKNRINSKDINLEIYYDLFKGEIVEIKK